MEEKIKQINELNNSISSLKDFLWILDYSNIDSTYGKNKRNEFSTFVVNSHLWTGSDNPKYYKTLSDKETMNELSEVMKPILRSLIEKKKAQLEVLVP